MPPSILIVDDHPTNLKLAVQLLKYSGYEVSQAENAETALALIRKSPPALLLLDIQLPTMDGIELARMLKTDARTKQVRIVAFTAHAMKEDMDKALAAGCDGYIIKPIDTRKFAQQVADFLAGAPLANESERR